MSYPAQNLLTADYPDLTQEFDPARPTSIPPNYIDGVIYGLVPNTGKDLTGQLQTALTAARVMGAPVSLLPGKYIYSGIITNAGGGLVCTLGEAWLENQDPTYLNMCIQFNSTDSSYLDGIEILGLKFSCSTRPDSGLSNGALEANHFIKVTKARNVRVYHNKFLHNNGGGVLLRDVEDSFVAFNEATDVWKDAFHITGSSRNITRAFNIVRGGGDDAFAVVGYTSSGVYPIGIADIGNRVYGVRKARGFAYVGCKDIKNYTCYVDGRIPSIIPQQSDLTGGKYNTACALYIAAESGGSPTYGCENVDVQGFTGEYIGPGIDNVGTPASTLQQIHVSAGNGAGNPHKNIRIHATMRNGATRGLFVIGAGFTQDIDADLIVEDNTDPWGILSLTSTPGTGNQHAVEFQNTRNVKLKLRANKIAKGAAVFDANCSGYYNVDVSVGSVSQVTATQTPVVFTSPSNIDVVDIKLNFETAPAASGVGSINRIIDNATLGITRSMRITGLDHAPAAANVVSGAPTRSVTLGTSPSVVLNYTGRPMQFYSRLGTVSAIGRTTVKGRGVATAVVTGASGTVSIQGDYTDLYVATTVVTLFNAKGVALGTGTVASSALAGGITTVTFDATGVNASFAVGMQMAIVSTMRTVPGRTNGIIDMPAETAVQVTYSVVPTCTICEQSY